MEKIKIIEILEKNRDFERGLYKKEHIERFASYCIRLFLEKDKKTKMTKNFWIQKKTDQDMATLYERVASEGLVFDGIHITIQSTGVSYDYVAYKNKMLLAYPESKIDMNLVFKDDIFNFSKKDGLIKYTHEFTNPFSKKDTDIIGAYTIIKNKRGEFITLLSKEDIEAHRKVAKTDFIWKQWYQEMAMKTVMKKACKIHFGDIFTGIEEMDNKNYDLDKLNTVDKNEMEAVKGQFTSNDKKGKKK